MSRSFVRLLASLLALERSSGFETGVSDILGQYSSGPNGSFGFDSRTRTMRSAAATEADTEPRTRKQISIRDDKKNRLVGYLV